MQINQIVQKKDKISQEYNWWINKIKKLYDDGTIDKKEFNITVKNC